jgi:S-(hydroxymethyl)glutathione dehydrogenase/alcohol dehydrogenase
MKAAVLYEPGKPVCVEDVEISSPRSNEVLIRTGAAGVCHSDLHYVNGVYPFRAPMVLGHEAAGTVEAVGDDVQYVNPGDRVITCLSVFCGKCRECLSGRMVLCRGSAKRRPRNEEPRLSKDGQPLSQLADLGAFAECMLVHENAVVKVSEEIPVDRAALIGCGVLTGYGAVTRTAAIETGSDVAVIGCGGIGLSAINSAALSGANRIIAVDRVSTKLELARQFGATDSVDASLGNSVEQVRELTDGGVDYSFEAIGLKQTAQDAFSMVRAGGVATVIGMLPPKEKVEVSGMELLMEKRLQGSMMGSNQFRLDMPRLVDFYLSGRFHLDPLISHRGPLEGINDAFEALRGGEVARQVMIFPS